MLDLRFLALPTLLIGGAYAAAQPPSIRPLGVLDLGNPISRATGVSADGATVVGESDVGRDRHAFRWTEATGLVDLGTMEASGTSSAEDVSDNGQVIVGTASINGLDHAFRWTPGGGMVDLGSLGGPTASSAARAVSADGNVVVGSFTTASGGGRPFRWTSGGGMVDLGSFPGALGFATAEGVSDSGAVVVGFSNAPASDTRLLAFRWKGGITEDLSLKGQPISAITCVSGDGRFMGGVNSKTLTDEGFRASRWTSDGTVQKFTSQQVGVPFDISLDGGVLVGATIFETDSDTINEATVWIDGNPQSLAQRLASEGADLSAWSTLSIANAVSENGRVVVGVGTLHPNNDEMAFRAVLPNRAPTLRAVKVVEVRRLANDVRVSRRRPRTRIAVRSSRSGG
ncbi:MAG TPA: hypothetical protein VGN57_10635 [Pirellulaceae bacterium]|jgi:probable HAF family extracellular repeat protein|nr:hypothetical protein [Pirellulaceae bacterium]